MSRAARLLIPVCLLFLPWQAAAQVLRGHVSDGAGDPVAAAIIRATGAADELTVLTNQEGAFTVTVGDGFELRSITVERIGFESRTFPAETLGRLDDIRLQVDSAPIQLGGIVVAGESQCRDDVGGSDAAAAVWAEARKSLEVTAIAQTSRVVRFQTETFERDLRPSDYSVLRGNASRRTLTADSPYRSISVGQMTNRGWFEGSREQGWELFAPDADILLTEEFADQHCFSAAVEAGTVLLHFQPNRVRRSFPELEGTLVLDAETSELRELRFTYVGSSDLRRGGHAGGEIRFFTAPNGLRVVGEWAIRAPVLSMTRQGFGSLAVNSLGVSHVREIGGRVLAVRDGDLGMELPLEPLDLGPQDEIENPQALTRRTASTRTTRGGNGAELVVRNNESTPFRVTHVQLRDCTNTNTRCGDHSVDLMIPPGESRVLLRVGKERVSDAFRFAWDYIGQDVDSTGRAEVADSVTAELAAAPGSETELIAGDVRPEESSTPNRLLAADIAEGRFGDAFEVITSLRPQWLNVRPTAGPTGAPVNVRVYVDDTPWTPGPESSPEDVLRSVEAGWIEAVEYLDGPAATLRWGTGHSQGAIFVTTRGR